MKRALWLLLFPLVAQAAEQDHSAHATSPPEPAQAEHDHSTAEHAHSAGGLVPPEPPAEADHSAHTASTLDVRVDRDNSPAMQEARHMSMMMHGGAPDYMLMAERFEQTDDDALQWDLHGWLGYDRHKLWLKAEGEYDTEASSTEQSEVQLLYSRAVAPFWDLQLGLRCNDAGADARNYAVLGVSGLAPYWFEIDAAAFLSEDGDLSARFEAEYDLRFTQRLLLQPRLELDYSFADDPGLLLGQGLAEASLGLRLRYEVRREVAPYVGVEWVRAYGDTRDLLRAAGHDAKETRVVAGFRLWY